jgi:VWFA-related protein
VAAALAAGVWAGPWTGLLAGQQTPSFRSAVTLVTVDVSVLDSDGAPVPGLTAADFEIKLNGRVRPVRVLTYVRAAGELPASTAPTVPALARPFEGEREGRQTVTNDGVMAAAKQAGEDRVFVLLVDDLSFEPMRGKALFTEAKHFISSLPAADLVGLATTSGSVAINPTADRARIRAALDKAAGESGNAQSLTPPGADAFDTAEYDADGSVGVSQAIEIDAGNMEALKAAIAAACFNGERGEVDSQVLDVLIATNTCAGQVSRQARTLASRTRQTTRRQVGSYVAALDAMRAATGLKHLVLLSDGLAVGRDVDQLMPVARAAATAGVQVSVLMEERDLSLSDGGRRQVRAASPLGNVRAQVDTGAPQRRIEDNRMYLAGGQLAAEMAGGQFYRIIGQPAPFFTRVRAASAAVYRLGVEPAPDLDPARITSVDAKVNRRGVFVHANRHGVAPAASALAASEPTVEDRLRAAVGQGQSHGAVPLRVATSVRRSVAARTLDVHINAAVPSTIAGPLVAMFGLARVPAPGEPLGPITSGRGTLSRAEEGSFQWSVVVPAAPGSYLLRVAVADAAGALGALEVPIDAELTPMGPFVASDIVTAWVDADGRAHVLALDVLPPAATSLQVLFELYAPAGGAASVLETLKDDVQVELSVTLVGESEPIDAREVVPRLSEGVLRTLAEFATADWRPGTYHIRARVRTGEQVVGRALSVVTISGR